MELKKTTKFTGKLKDISFQEGILYDEDGVEIDLLNQLRNAYGDKVFTINITSQTDEIIDIED